MSDPMIVTNPSRRDVVPDAGFGALGRSPLRTHQSLDGYAPTPLLSLPGLAERLGVASVQVKDESSRLGLPSFKILGASWAVLTAVAREWLADPPELPTVLRMRESLASGPPGRTLAAATDGNHGRGVARMAGLLGLQAHVLMPAGTAQARIDAIAAEGARVEVVDGTYDDAVAASAALADARTLVISDTSWPGYERVPRSVIDGYSTLFHEIDDAEAAAGLPAPTLVAVQAGVGAFAAAALRHYRGEVPRVHRARTVVVEPIAARCLLESARVGQVTEVPGPHPSTMAGLNCGLPSLLAWPVIAAGTDVFVAIDDEWAYAAMRALAAEGVESGESGAAGLAGLLAAAADPVTAAEVGLHPDAHVLVVNTEGVTDPANAAAVLGPGAGRELV